jgi:hypothetical protein
MNAMETTFYDENLTMRSRKEREPKKISFIRKTSSFIYFIEKTQQKLCPRKNQFLSLLLSVDHHHYYYYYYTLLPFRHDILYPFTIIIIII